MPKFKYKREDVIRSEELEEMFNKLEGNDYMTGYYKTHLYGEEITQNFRFNCRMVQCLIALLWLFGKRKIENLTLRRRDVYVRGRWLYVRFKVRKKKDRKQEATPITYLKKVTLDNPYVEYVLRWVETIDNPDAYIFPGRTRPKIRTVKMRNKETGKVKVYTYRDEEEGYLSPQMAWKIIKFLNPKAWVHLFRHSVATQMAEEGATEDELMAWFDWDHPVTPHKYVKRGTRLIEKWAERKW